MAFTLQDMFAISRRKLQRVFEIGRGYKNMLTVTLVFQDVFEIGPRYKTVNHVQLTVTFACLCVAGCV
jgi:hypothetical protein